jgi:hypothetical protein
MGEKYDVRVVEMSHFQDGEFIVKGFPTLDLAKEFSRRWVRDSLEEMRKTGQTKEELRKLWYAWGEDAVVVAGDYRGSCELDFFIDNPATAEERDWKAVKREAGVD